MELRKVFVGDAVLKDVDDSQSGSPGVPPCAVTCGTCHPCFAA